jgi:hypothetical protein
MTPVVQKTYFEFRKKIGGPKTASGTCGTTHNQEDTRRRAPKWAFLGGAPFPHDSMRMSPSLHPCRPRDLRNLE